MMNEVRASHRPLNRVHPSHDPLSKYFCRNAGLLCGPQGAVCMDPVTLPTKLRKDRGPCQWCRVLPDRRLHLPWRSADEQGQDASKDGGGLHPQLQGVDNLSPICHAMLSVATVPEVCAREFTFVVLVLMTLRRYCRQPSARKRLTGTSMLTSYPSVLSKQIWSSSSS